MTPYERFLLTEHERRIQEGERRGWLEADLRRNRPTLRHEGAGQLLALAYRLSPEMTPTNIAGERGVPARGRA